MQPKLIILRGNSGSGKTADYTYSAKVDKNLCTIFFLV